jgi:hypothetical protein
MHRKLPLRKNRIRDRWRNPGETDTLHMLVLCEAGHAVRLL